MASSKKTMVSKTASKSAKKPTTKPKAPAKGSNAPAKGGMAPVNANATQGGADKNADKKRTFTVESSSTGVKSGRYVSESPLDAAKKAATQLFRKAGGENSSTVKMTLRETTRGSDKKTWKYVATRVKKDKPISVKINPGTANEKTIVYKFDIDVKSVSKN